MAAHYRDDATKAEGAQAFFAARPGSASVLACLDDFAATPTVATATALVDAYFAVHVTGDLRGLRALTSAFASKRTTLAIVRSVLADPAILAAVAARSYPHAIGFDKLVLHHHPAGHKLRLHIYWRSPQELDTEQVHLHRFEMASSPITGELTNHLYAVNACSGREPLHLDRGKGLETPYFVYTGFERDADGTLHRRYLGEALLREKGAMTFVPGQTYAQALHHPHYVETNAETGHTNGDVCSTVFVHGPFLRDAPGRTLALLFEDERTADTVVTPTPTMSAEAVVETLERYARLLEESIAFYEWLYDPRYGRNLSVGMVAGYLLSEAFRDRNTLQIWERHHPACIEVLQGASGTLNALVRGQLRVADLPEYDRSTRYFQHLVNKSHEHADGQATWLAAYGDLAREFSRYAEALVGDYARDPDLRVLKPIWALDDVSFRSGAHYGRIKAMLDAIERCEETVLQAFRTGPASLEDDGEGPVTATDRQVHERVRELLATDYPGTPLVGEHEAATPPAPSEGTTRWNLDAIDGTRNFVSHNADFAIALVHERYAQGAWSGTDAVVAAPARRERFWAEAGCGAFHIDATGFEARLRIDASLQLDGALVECSLRGLGDAEGVCTSALSRAGARLRMGGSAALAVAKVAGRGNAAALVTANDYDVAAACLVAREAGAIVSTLPFVRQGRGFTMYLAAQSPEVHEFIRAAAADAIATFR